MTNDNSRAELEQLKCMSLGNRWLSNEKPFGDSPNNAWLPEYEISFFRKNAKYPDRNRNFQRCI